MGRTMGYVAELGLVAGEEQVRIACSPEFVPAPGQYLMGASRGAVQATPLFLTGKWKQGFLAPKPFPSEWQPGTELTLYGPLGTGFSLPGDVQRLALIASGETHSRLLPLAGQLQYPQANITLFSDAPLADLPPELEVYPMQDLPEYLNWADFYAVDAPIERLGTLQALFNYPDGRLASIRGQVLVHSSMPCLGLGRCGVCAVKVKRAWKHACEDGPVFELADVIKEASW
jgi:hypothetical protein